MVQAIQSKMNLHDQADGSEDDSSDDGGHATGRLDPYLISEKQFSEECPSYQKLVVMYYRGDDVLTDDSEAPISDIRGTVGLGTLGKFGQDPDNPNVIFVRNDRIEVDFEICLDYGSYIEVVLKYGTPNPKPPRATRA